MTRHQASSDQFSSVAVAVLVLLCGSVFAQPTSQANAILRGSETVRAINSFRVSGEDERLIDEIQHGCFLYFWNEVGQPAQLVKDRRNAEISSVAAVGFQLSSLPIGVARGWVSREQANQRAIRILECLLERDDNKKFGIYLHFVNHNTAGLDPNAPQVQASTIDHALLVAGAITAASYFGGEVDRLTDRILQDAQWARFVNSERQLLSFGWRPDDPHQMDGAGTFRPWVWQWASCEERLVYFLAVAAPRKENRVEASMYYRPERVVMQHDSMPPFVASWSGTLFNFFFSHCWINYRAFEADHPQAFGESGPRVDWFENSRRATLTHRQRCIEAQNQFKSFGETRWGLSPCSGFRQNGESTYLVPSVMPNTAKKDNFCFGTIAPYAAGSSIMFTPHESLDALREFRRIAEAYPYVGWRDPADGGYGLPDSFNLDQKRASHDTLGIDAGPLLLALENVRTGLIWDLFHQHRVVKNAESLLQLERRK